jgi:5'-nucleotidase
MEVKYYISTLKEDVDRKYNAIISRIARKLTHPIREEETSLGNLITDIFWHSAGVDVVFLGSGSIRGAELGPMVTLGALQRIFPYDDSMLRFTVTGAKLKGIFEHIMRSENRDGEGECYQVNSGVQAVYVNRDNDLESLTISGSQVKDDAYYTIGLQNYHYQNSENNLGITSEELSVLTAPKVITTSLRDILEEYMSTHQNMNSQIEERLVYK